MKKPQIKVFISFSTDDTPGDRRTDAVQWALREFKPRVCRLSGYSPDEVYLYTDPRNAPIGASLRKEIPEGLGSTEHMICLISDEYLESVWCLDEYWRFVSRADTNRSAPIFVITPLLNRESYARREHLAERVRQGIELMKNSRDTLFSDELEEFANSRWTEDIVSGCHDKRHIDLFRDDWDDAENRFPILLARPRSRFVLDYAGLSAYCLGADRYLSGGWGFSLTNTFRYDQEDGEELPNGPYGLNVVILRALSKFLDDSEFRKERSAVFPLEPAKRNPVQAVRDRLPYFAALLSCLENPQATSFFLSTHAEAAHRSLAGFEPQSRWTLAHIDAVSPSEEYYASVFACLDLAQRLAEDDEARLVLEKARLYDEKPYFARFVEHCKTAIAQKDLLKMLLGDLGQQDAPDRASRASMFWLLLAGCPKGQELLAAHISDRVEDHKQNARLIDRISDGIKRADVDSLTISLTICACVLCCTHRIEGDFPAKLIDSLYELLFNRTESYQIVPKLNAVAWAAIIIIATKEAKEILERKDLARLWRDGLGLRQQRLEYVKQLSQVPGQLSRANLDSWKIRFLKDQVERWINQVPTLYSRMARKSDEQFEEFSRAVAHATFWGTEPGTSDAAPQSETILGGVLRVNCKSDRVEMDSPGYNRIFLRPFSQITGMNVIDLNGIRREFGGLDRKLVEIMSETVVQQVYVRRGNKYECDNCDFVRRTIEITDRLKNDKWNLEEGMDDFLIVRREDDQQDASPRLIHRSAIVQKPRKEGADPVISWRFLEMPPIMKSIIIMPDKTT
jgi:hypothetical protein